MENRTEKMENVYTSTGMKFLHHPDAITRLRARGRATPISLQIAPTSRCNLSCTFCSNVNRNRQEDLDPKRIEGLFIRLSHLGVKTVEWTGGGDPLLYPDLDYVTTLARVMGMKQGLITNGLALKEKGKRLLSKFHWVRVSMNCLDYVRAISLPIENFSTLGFSYVFNEKTTPDVLERLREHVLAYQPKYVRFVPNCQSTYEQQEANNERYSKMVEEMGEPYFYQAKHFARPERCWWCYFKPFILHDGYVYPCSSVVLNDEAERSFHAKYRWCEMEELPDKYEQVVQPFDTTSCSHCVFRPQNDIVDSLINPNGMEDFV